jgi:hypothetical protein
MMYGTIYRYNYTYNITARILIHSSFCVFTFMQTKFCRSCPHHTELIKPDAEYGEDGMTLAGVK